MPSSPSLHPTPTPLHPTLLTPSYPLPRPSSNQPSYFPFFRQTLEGGDGDGDAPVSKSLHDLTAASNRNGEELDDERQLRMLQQDLHGDRGDAARWGIGEVSVRYGVDSVLSGAWVSKLVRLVIPGYAGYLPGYRTECSSRIFAEKGETLPDGESARYPFTCLKNINGVLVRAYSVYSAVPGCQIWSCWSYLSMYPGNTRVSSRPPGRWVHTQVHTWL